MITKIYVYNLLHATLMLVPLFTLTIVSFIQKTHVDIRSSCPIGVRVKYDTYNKEIKADNEVKAEGNLERMLKEEENEENQLKLSPHDNNPAWKWKYC